MDMNIQVEVTHNTKEAFKLAMELIFLEQKYFDKTFTCDGYSFIDGQLFLASNSAKANPLPYKFNAEQTIEFAWGWLELAQPSTDKPNIDGSSKLGYRVTTKNCGIGSDDWATIVSMKRVWLIYGK